MPTRSTVLGALKPAAATNTTVFTVPAGMTYLVKSIFVAGAGGTADTVYVTANDPNGTIVWWYWNQPLPIAGRLEWEGWFALNPGQFVVINSANGASGFWINGAKLIGTA